MTAEKVTFTPGPWVHNEMLSGSENHRGFRVGPSGKFAIAWVPPMGSDVTPEAKANARLIAAAPELLRCLVGATMAMQKTPDNEAILLRITHEELQAIEALIAKVEGR